VWLQSPVLMSVGYLIFGLIMPSGLFVIIFKIWRPLDRE
jgi:hypothetical protein